MSENDVNRRDVLRSASVGAVAAAGGVAVVKAEQTEYGPVRLVEAAIQYRLPTKNNYDAAHLTGEQLYHVDDQAGVVLHDGIPTRFEEAVKQNNLVVGTEELATLPVTVSGTTPTKRLTTRIRQRRVPATRISLAEPYTPPMVLIEERGTGPTAVVNGRPINLTPGTSERLTLSTETVVAETFTVTDESPDIEGIPDHRIGPKTEFDETTVEVTPEVLLTDRGELPVSRVSN